jgi:hypothetical protein
MGRELRLSANYFRGSVPAGLLSIAVRLGVSTSTFASNCLDGVPNQRTIGC